MQQCLESHNKHSQDIFPNLKCHSEVAENPFYQCNAKLNWPPASALWPDGDLALQEKKLNSKCRSGFRQTRRNKVSLVLSLLITLSKTIVLETTGFVVLWNATN